jgi:hypothetical protein
MVSHAGDMATGGMIQEGQLGKCRQARYLQTPGFEPGGYWRGLPKHPLIKPAVILDEPFLTS